MVRVQRSNVVLTVDEKDIPYYLNRGFNLTDNVGGIIQRAVPNDFATLQKYYVEQGKRIEELETTVAKLTSELMEARKAAEKPKSGRKKSVES